MKSRLITAAATMALIALTGCGAPATSTGGSSDTTSQTAAKAAAGSCVYQADGQAAKPADPPSTDDVATSGIVTFVMAMTAGNVTLTLDRADAPCAVNSFESLVAQGYFNDTDCHRLVVGFVLQCGDPSGTGSGGPGYSFADELTGHETYPRGTVAMANAGANTNGSQFFIVLADADLPPSYDVLGTVDDASMAVVDAIAARGVDKDDPMRIKPAWGAHVNTVTAG